MARYAIVIDGRVDNVIEADDPQFAQDYASERGAVAVASDTAGPGDIYSGGQFSQPAPSVTLPDAVTKYALIDAAEDVLNVTEADIDAALAAMAAGRPKRRLQAWWRGGGVLVRQGQRMADLQALMGWNGTQMGNLFAAAARVGD